MLTTSLSNNILSNNQLTHISQFKPNDLIQKCDDYSKSFMLNYVNKNNNFAILSLNLRCIA